MELTVARGQGGPSPGEGAAAWAARWVYCVRSRCKQRCKWTCTCGVEAGAARSASGKREVRRDFGLFCQPSQKRASAITCSQANLATPLHTTNSHNNSSTELVRTRHCRARRRRSPLGLLLPLRRRHISSCGRSPASLPHSAPWTRRRAAVGPCAITSTSICGYATSTDWTASAPIPQRSGYLITSKNTANHEHQETSLLH